MNIKQPQHSNSQLWLNKHNRSDTSCTSESGWVCVLCGWLGTGRSGEPAPCPVWCRHRGYFPPHSSWTRRKWWSPAEQTFIPPVANLSDNISLHCLYLSTVTELISLLFALVGPDEQLESVLEQQPLGDVRAEVAASSSERVGTAARLGFGVTPQYVHYLQQGGNPDEQDAELNHNGARLNSMNSCLWPVSIPDHMAAVREGEQRTGSPGKALGGHWWCKACWEKMGTDEARGRMESEVSRWKRRRTRRRKNWRRRCLVGWAHVASSFRQKGQKTESAIFRHLIVHLNFVTSVSICVLRPLTSDWVLTGSFGSCFGFDCCWDESRLSISFSLPVCWTDRCPAAPDCVGETSGQISPGGEEEKGRQT